MCGLTPYAEAVDCPVIPRYDAESREYPKESRDWIPHHVRDDSLRRSSRLRYQIKSAKKMQTSRLNTAEAVDLGTNLIFSFLSKLRETASNTNDSFPMVNIDDSPFSQM